ncbi:unnamed protein product [Enterobius vermicularis]|uniref:RES domain-containing protein n=1 Tax=Enterobius vermicularis TaxID=51028 RepID=A0A0N4V3I0_ENTVE|nr:unnamed protein product [Enterobius vermicularis]
MRQLACRFCKNTRHIFVVDPQLDLRYRFENRLEMSKMLKARTLMVDLKSVEASYMKWWEAYENLCELSKTESDKFSVQKKFLLSLEDGLLDALRLPNDVESFSYTAPNLKLKKRKPTFLSYLEESGMLKVSPPNIVRGAVIEGVNIPLDNYLAFTDGSISAVPQYLTGGCCSKVELSTNPQRTKIVALSFCTSKNDALEEYCFWKSSIGNLISSKLAFDFEFVTLPVRNLFNFESGASIAVYDDLEVARIAFCGDYISRRLNITVDTESELLKFLHLVYTEIDVTKYDQ